MYLTSVLIVLSILLFALFRMKTNRRNYLFSKIPSPKKYFLLHNLPEVLGLDQTEVFEKIQNYHSKLGDIIHITFHPFDCGFVFVADHEIAQILSNNQPDRKRSIIYEFLSGWVGSNGAFLGSGSQQKEKFKLLKRTMNPEFHQKYLSLVSSHMEIAINELNITEKRQIEFFSWIDNIILDISFGKIFKHARGETLIWSHLLHPTPPSRQATFSCEHKFLLVHTEMKNMSQCPPLNPLS
jgi:truncated hemoglobin YjbI